MKLSNQTNWTFDAKASCSEHRVVARVSAAGQKKNTSVTASCGSTRA